MPGLSLTPDQAELLLTLVREHRPKTANLRVLELLQQCEDKLIDIAPPF